METPRAAKIDPCKFEGPEGPMVKDIGASNISELLIQLLPMLNAVYKV